MWARSSKGMLDWWWMGVGDVSSFLFSYAFSFFFFSSKLPIALLFRNVEARINGVLVTQNHSMYPYVGYLTTLLNYGVDARSSRLLPTGWRTEKNLNDLRGDNGYLGFRERAKLTELSHKTTFLGPLFLDLFMQDRFLIPLCSIDLTFTLSKWQFALRVNTADDVDANYKIKIDKFKVLLNRVKVAPSIAARMEERLQVRRSQFFRYLIKFINVIFTLLFILFRSFRDLRHYILFGHVT